MSAAPPPEAGDYVVLSEGAWLRRAADGEPQWQLELDTAAVAGLSDPPRGFAFRLVRRFGDTLELETLPEPEPDHCAPTLPGFGGLAVRFFARAADAMPVTHAPLAVHFDDGTAVTLAAGVPLRAVDGDPAVANAAGVFVSVPLSQMPARAYDPAGGFEPEAQDAQRILDTVALVVDGRPVRGREALFRLGEGARVFGTSQDDRGLVVKLRGRCVELVVRAKADGALDPADDVWHSSLFGLGATGKPEGLDELHFQLEAGTELFWPDGAKAGEVRFVRRFSAAPENFGRRECLAMKARPRPLKLCADPSAITEVDVFGRPTEFLAVRRESPARVPRVRQLRARVDPGLDEDIVRRIVRAHINEVRHCYNQTLVRDPGAGGTVTAVFRVGPKGKVGSATASSSNAKLAQTARCMGKALLRWKFPRPSTPEVAVTYPFRLSPG